MTGYSPITSSTSDRILLENRADTSRRSVSSSQSQGPDDSYQPDDRFDETSNISLQSGADRTGLSRELSERHVNMIGFSCVVGVGLFLQNGRVINLAGPGMGFLAYLLMGLVIWCAQAALGEMTALFPIEGAMFELPARFLDQSIGYAAGWMAWFAWVVVAAAELNAIAALFRFRFEPKYLQEVVPNGGYPQSSLEWSTVGVNSAVWVTIFWFAILMVNSFKVRWFGEIEYWAGVLKMLFFVGLILFQFIIHLQMGLGFKYYKDPYDFLAPGIETNRQPPHTGHLAQLAGVWTAMTTSIFSLTGVEAVSITARENRDFNSPQGIKISTRKLAIRIITLYVVSTFIVGLNIPYNDPNIKDTNIAVLGGGERSAFIIAAVHAHKTFWPGFINAVFIFSATSCGSNSLYLASRLLHALSLSPRAWPRFAFFPRLREWLAQTNRHRVPFNAVFGSWLFGMLAYLSTGSAPEKELGRLALNATVSMLIVYAVISIACIRFIKKIKEVSLRKVLNRTDIDPDLWKYDRNAEGTYPYRVHWLEGRCYFAAFGCSTMAILNGWRSIIPFDTADFLASYVSIFVFMLLCLYFRCSLQGMAAGRFALYPKLSLADPNSLDPSDPKLERHRITFSKDRTWSLRNLGAILSWSYAWLL